MFVFLTQPLCDLTYFFPSFFVRQLACSLPVWRVSMFLSRVSLLELRIGCRVASTENVAVFGECCPADRDSSLNLFVFVVAASGAVRSTIPIRCSFQRSLSEWCWVMCCWCIVFHSHLCLSLVHRQDLVWSIPPASSCSICCRSLSSAKGRYREDILRLP